MAILTNPQRQQLWAAFMRKLSNDRDELSLTKPELRAAVDAIDQWIEDNAISLNAAIPLPARTALSTTQKAALFFFVANKRFDVI